MAVPSTRAVYQQKEECFCCSLFFGSDDIGVAAALREQRYERRSYGVVELVDERR